MKVAPPAWAMRAARREDRAPTLDAQKRGTMQVVWPDMNALRRWAGDHGWAAPRFGFESAFLDGMLETDENFALAIDGSGIAIRIPKREQTISSESIGDLDRLYAERSPTGRPTGWGLLVEELREIRRAVEAGVAVSIEGSITLRTWGQFYDWAHGRYHALEDGIDQWIGDDGS